MKQTTASGRPAQEDPEGSVAEAAELGERSEAASYPRGKAEALRTAGYALSVLDETNRELARTSSEREHLTRILSHDLRNPFSAIRQMLQFIDKCLPWSQGKSNSRWFQSISTTPWKQRHRLSAGASGTKTSSWKKRLMARYGGSIDITSSTEGADHGTTVAISLPVGRGPGVNAG